MKADAARTLQLLKTARGQIDGVIRMVEDDRYCIDISNQIQAAQAILGKANAEVLKAHVHHCVRTAVAQGNAEEKLEEISLILEKLAKK